MYKDWKSSSTSDDVHNPTCLHQNRASVRYSWARMRRHLVFHYLMDPKIKKKGDGFRLMEAITKVLNFTQQTCNAKYLDSFKRFQ